MNDGRFSAHPCIRRVYAAEYALRYICQKIECLHRDEGSHILIPDSDAPDWLDEYLGSPLLL